MRVVVFARLRRDLSATSQYLELPSRTSYVCAIALASLPTWEKIDFGPLPKIGKMVQKWILLHWENKEKTAPKTGEIVQKWDFGAILGPLFLFRRAMFFLFSQWGQFWSILGGGPKSVVSQLGKLATLPPFRKITYIFSFSEFVRIRITLQLHDIMPAELVGMLYLLAVCLRCSTSLPPFFLIFALRA